jgi:MFS family permease
LGPVISSVSDTFQARKIILVGSSLISLVGAAIAPGAHSMNRLIVAQTLIGVGFASVPLAYCVPSEILPRRWRPSEFRRPISPACFADRRSVAQAGMNIAASVGAIMGPMVIGSFVNDDPVNGWRKFYVCSPSSM